MGTPALSLGSWSNRVFEEYMDPPDLEDRKRLLSTRPMLGEKQHLWHSSSAYLTCSDTNDSKPAKPLCKSNEQPCPWLLYELGHENPRA